VLRGAKQAALRVGRKLGKQLGPAVDADGPRLRRRTNARRVLD
jgi:hypothetical protein